MRKLKRSPASRSPAQSPAARIPVTHLDNHASYISHWLKLLKSDDRAMLMAAAKAEEASSLLLRLGGHDERSDSAFGDDLAEVA